MRAKDFAPLAFKAESKHLNLMLALANRLNRVRTRAIGASGKLGDVYGIDMHLIADQTRFPPELSGWFADRERAVAAI